MTLPSRDAPHNWLFAGLADRLAEEGDHLTIDLPGLSVTIQNFRGELAGFLNVCSHRATRLRPRGCGKGHLRCPYHGWTYNSRGVPIGIPENEALFGLSREDKEKLALKSVEVEACGSFVFLRVASGGPPLKDHLGRLAGELEARSLTAADRVSAKEGMAGGSWAFPEGGLEVPPNLRLQEAEGWTLLTACTRLATDRSLLSLELFRSGGASADLPAALARQWEAASLS